MKLITETFLQKIVKITPDFMSHIKESDIYQASKVYESWDEVFSSEEYDEIWDGFQGKESSAKVKRNYEFVTAFVVDADPKKNYGKPFRMFTVHKHDGVKILKQVEKSSMLSSSPMREVYLFDDCFILGDRYFAKGCKKTWDVLKETESTVM